MGDDLDERTAYVKGLHEQVDVEILKELFNQVGPINTVSLRGKEGFQFAFVEFKHEESVLFACEMLGGVRLFDRSITVLPRENTKNADEFKKIQNQKRQEERYYRSQQQQHQYYQQSSQSPYGMPPGFISPMTSFQNMDSQFRTPQPPAIRRSYSDDFQRDQRYSVPVERYGSSDHLNGYRGDGRNAQSFKSPYEDRSSYSDRRDGYSDRRNDYDQRRDSYNSRDRDQYQPNSYRRQQEYETPRGTNQKRNYDNDRQRDGRDWNGGRRYEDKSISPKRRRW